MLEIKELRPLARALDATRFERQLGPFALVQRPPPTEASLKDVAKKTVFSQRPPEDSALALILEFDNLVVFTLPPMRTVDELVVGRLPTCDIVLADPSVSKRHAALRWDASQRVCTVTDLGSRNGTWINEAQVDGDGVLLTDGDVVSFGDVDYWYLVASTLQAKLRGLPARVAR